MFALLLASALTIANWVPARWFSSEPDSLSLLDGAPINCLLLEPPHWNPSLSHAAAQRSLITLGIIRPTDDFAQAVASLRQAALHGALLEGNFSDEQLSTLHRLLPSSDFPIIEMLPRARLRLRDPLPIVATYQGVWPGILLEEEGKTHAAPTGSPWIHTNAGFLRFVRAATSAPVWIGHLPPANRRLTTEHYIQAIADAAAGGARWVIALDDGFAQLLLRRDANALNSWRRINAVAAFYEAHPEWRTLPATGALAVLQEPDSGALLSGGILDMIAVKHTPFRPVPLWTLSSQRLEGAQMAVNVDAQAVTPPQKEILRSFTRSGGTLLSGPPGNTGYANRVDAITLDEKEVATIDNLWRGVNSMIGRENLGVRLFNVASMLSTLLTYPDNSRLVLHLVNYSGYPVDNITAQLKGKWNKATIYSPDGAPRLAPLHHDASLTEVEIDSLHHCATIVIE